MIAVLLMIAPAPADYRPRDLSDRDIIAFQRATYDKALLERTRVILGLYHGATVVADFPCSDVCSRYTTRIIHCDVNVGSACAALGGLERPAKVPEGVAEHREVFCVPVVLGTELVRVGD